MRELVQAPLADFGRYMTTGPDERMAGQTWSFWRHEDNQAQRRTTCSQVPGGVAGDLRAGGVYSELGLEEQRKRALLSVELSALTKFHETTSTAWKSRARWVTPKPRRTAR